MPIFKVGTRDDDLCFYVNAQNKQQAQDKIENLIGPLPMQRSFIVEVKEVPEGEELL